MADPLLTDFFKCQVVFSGPSGLPTDKFVNGWFFRNDDPIGANNESVADSIAAVLSAFYAQVAPTNTLLQYMSPTITGSFAELRIYDLGQVPPRTPIIRQMTLGPRGSAPLPSEVALVMSFYGPSNLPRNRGRLYLGPLSLSAMGGTTTPSVITALRSIVQNRALDVINTTQNVTWVQVSQVAAKADVVVNGWVDDDFDTQRRRGPRATTRTYFTPL